MSGIQVSYDNVIYLLNSLNFIFLNPFYSGRTLQLAGSEMVQPSLFITKARKLSTYGEDMPIFSPSGGGKKTQ